jgi:hypothetical protein
MFQPNSQSDPLDCRNKGPALPLGTEMIEDHQGLNDEHRPHDVANGNVAVAPENQRLPEETIRLHEQIRILEQVISCILSTKPFSYMIYKVRQANFLF